MSPVGNAVFHTLNFRAFLTSTYVFRHLVRSHFKVMSTLDCP